jgi:3-dehydroquinate synthetase
VLDLLHGECVAIGMMSETRIARAIGALPSDSPALRRLEQCLIGNRDFIELCFRTRPF